MEFNIQFCKFGLKIKIEFTIQFSIVMKNLTTSPVAIH